jgi:hypothetical protein
MCAVALIFVTAPVKVTKVNIIARNGKIIAAGKTERGDFTVIYKAIPATYIVMVKYLPVIVFSTYDCRG